MIRPDKAASTDGPFQEARAVFFAESMSCASCIARIESALIACSGVHHVQINLPKKLVTVLFDPSKVTPNQLMNVTYHAGYPMVLATGKYVHHVTESRHLQSRFRLIAAWLLLIASIAITFFMNDKKEPVWQLLSFCLNTFIVFACGRNILSSAFTLLKNFHISSDILIIALSTSLLAAGFYAMAHSLLPDLSVAAGALMTFYLSYDFLNKKSKSTQHK